MRRFVVFLVCFALLAVAAGCGLVYELAVDPRDMDTISRDKEIAAAIQAGLLDDESVKLLDVSVYCYEGDVYVIGEYVNEEQKERILEIASGADGVRSVTPYLFPPMKTISCGVTDNLRIEAQVREALAEGAGMWSTRVEVKVVQCRIVLLGMVASSREADDFVDRAKKIKGARGVESFLKVLRE